jgi:hypothetical protein
MRDKVRQRVMLVSPATLQGMWYKTFSCLMWHVVWLVSQGTLRDALDKRRLPRLSGTPFPHPAVVFSLCHDITAALLHLHTEGIV